MVAERPLGVNAPKVIRSSRSGMSADARRA
jgi:hypothetical protein